MNGQIWFKVPETINFKLVGEKPDHIMAKDIILKIIGEIGTDGANYKTMQFSGNITEQLGMDERLTLTNRGTEAGAKNGIIEPDIITDSYLRKRTNAQYYPVLGDIDAEFSESYTYEIDNLEPIVAKPFSPGNISTTRELQGVELDKAYIGFVTGAKLQDLRVAAKLLKGRKVKIRTEVLPAGAINLHAGYKRRVSRTFPRGWCGCWSSYMWSLLWCAYGCPGQKRDMHKHD